MSEEEAVGNHQNPPSARQDNLERFRTHRKRDVVSNLLELSQRVEPLTILFEAGKHSFPTSIIDVISDQDLVIFERAGSAKMNDKLLVSERGTIIGQPDGVKVRFVLDPISASEHQGEQVLVAPVPSEHYRMQRRQFFRINTQILNPVMVTLKLPNGEEASLRVGNLSSGGLRLDDVDNLLEYDVLDLLSDCTIQIPEASPLQVDLEVRNSYELTNKKGNQVHYVGCAFKNMLRDQESNIQNYINILQVAERAKENR